MELPEVKTEIFKLFVESLRRVRWCVLSSVALAAVGLIHLYLDNSITDQLWQSVVAQSIKEDYKANLDAREVDLLNRVREYRFLPQYEVELKNLKSSVATQEKITATKKKIDDLNNKIKQAKEAGNDLYTNIDDYAAARFYFDRDQSTIKDIRLKDGTLPLINMSIPSEDVLIIICLLQAILAITLYLLIRSLYFPMTLLIGDPVEPYQEEEASAAPGKPSLTDLLSAADQEQQRRKLMNSMLHMHVLSTSMLDKNTAVGRAKFVESLSIWGPSSVMLANIAADAYSNWYDWHSGSYIGPPHLIATRFCILATAFIIIVWSTVLTQKELRICLKTLLPPMPPAIAPMFDYARGDADVNVNDGGERKSEHVIEQKI